MILEMTDPLSGPGVTVLVPPMIRGLRSGTKGKGVNLLHNCRDDESSDMCALR